MVEAGSYDWGQHVSPEVKADNQRREAYAQRYRADELLDGALDAVVAMRGLRQTVNVGSETVPNRYFRIEPEGSTVTVTAIAEVHRDITKIRSTVMNTQEMADIRMGVEHLRGINLQKK